MAPDTAGGEVDASRRLAPDTARWCGGRTAARGGCLVTWALALLLGALALLAGTAARAQALQPVPALTARVIDLTGTLSTEQRAALQARLAAFERERGSQVVVLMVPTTAPEDITDYTQRVGDAWKIGRRDVGDGVLLVVAKDDRRLRIATTKAVEGAIPDLLASRIIERAIVPRFRNGDYFGGLQAGVEQILAALAGEPLPLPGDVAASPGASVPDGEGAVVFAVFAVPVIATVLRALLGRVLGAVGTAALAAVVGAALGLPWAWLALLVAVAFVLALAGITVGQGAVGGPWRGPGGEGGWPGGGGPGGGFSSGGGGNFGGGGASGRW